jgi:hypothetical protein
MNGMIDFYVLYPTIFSFRVLDLNQNIFSSRIIHEKWNANLPFSCFLCLRVQSSLSKQNTGSVIRKNAARVWIPDPWGKKAPVPYPQHWLNTVCSAWLRNAAFRTTDCICLSITFQVIHACLADRTVLTIAHRVETVLGCDR